MIKLNATLPRLVINRSNKHMFGQVISGGVTVLGLADLKITTGTKVEKAYQLGAQLGSKLIEKGITQVVFDRNGYLYHGRVKSMCEGVRSSGVTI
jgi:large subunit ribosomal protein L18